MKEEELPLYLGSIFYGIWVETFLDNEFKKGKIRIRPIPNQDIPSELHVVYPRSGRELVPLGTKFKLDVRLCRKAKGKFYLNPVRKKEFFIPRRETAFSFFEKQRLLPF